MVNNLLTNSEANTNDDPPPIGNKDAKRQGFAKSSADTSTSSGNGADDSQGRGEGGTRTCEPVHEANVHCSDQGQKGQGQDGNSEVKANDATPPIGNKDAKCHNYEHKPATEGQCPDGNSEVDASGDPPPIGNQGAKCSDQGQKGHGQHGNSEVEANDAPPPTGNQDAKRHNEENKPATEGQTRKVHSPRTGAASMNEGRDSRDSEPGKGNASGYFSVDTAKCTWSNKTNPIDAFCVATEQGELPRPPEPSFTKGSNRSSYKGNSKYVAKTKRLDLPKIVQFDQCDDWAYETQETMYKLESLAAKPLSLDERNQLVASIQHVLSAYAKGRSSLGSEYHWGLDKQATRLKSLGGEATAK